MGYKGGYANARKKEQEQYNLWKEDYEASKGRYQQALGESADLKTSALGQYDDMIGQYDSRSTQDQVDFRQAMDSQLSAQNQAFASRGLSGSSFSNNAYAGNRRDTAFGLNNIRDQRLGGRLGLQDSRLRTEIGLTADNINLLQAGPTSPSTAMYNASVQNLGQAMSYKLAQQAWDASQKGPNQSWSKEASNWFSPEGYRTRIETLAGVAAGAVTGGAANGQTFQSGPTNAQGNYGGQQFGSQTSAMTQGQQQAPQQGNYGSGASVFSGQQPQGQAQQQQPRAQTPWVGGQQGWI